MKASQSDLVAPELRCAAASLVLKQGRVFNRALLRASLLAEIVTLPYLRAEIDVHFICQSSVRRLSKVDSRSSISSATFQREMKRLSDSLIKNKTKNKKSERRRLSSPSLFPHHAASSAKMLTQPDVGDRESQNYNILTQSPCCDTENEFYSHVMSQHTNHILFNKRNFQLVPGT